MFKFKFKTHLAVWAVVALGACATAAFVPTQAGLLEFGGSQRTIFEQGKAEAVVPLTAMSGTAETFGVGAVAGLDGEITVFKGMPYVTKVRGSGFTMEHGTEHAATFAVWTRQPTWTEQPIPADVKGYVDLQSFVKARAAAAGIDVSKPFPFQVSGTPVEVKWHINVDLTEGKPVTPELFAKSKANFSVRNEAVDILGELPAVFRLPRVDG
jgi:acetolactate decarboxylase